jgi:hypothetical protein
VELISIALARAVWLLDIRDTNPRGMNLRHTLLPALVEKYRFSKYPSDSELNENKEEGEKFQSGEFHNSEGQKIVVHLTFFDTGLVAETRSSTRDSEAFLDDVTGWMVAEFGLVFRPELLRQKGYLSQVYVRTEHSLDALNPKLRDFAARLSSLVSVPFETFGINLAANADMSVKPGMFSFERALNIPFRENRYWSQAPLHTDTHLELLQEFEQILAI